METMGVIEEHRCTGQGDLFFSDDARDLAVAQSICASCPARKSCLEAALESGAEWGVWGGVVFWDGQPMWRKRGRGRPRIGEAQQPVEMSFEDLRLLLQSA